MLKKILFSIICMVMLLFTIIGATAVLIPVDSYDYKNKFNITNVSYFTVSNICISGDCKSVWPTGGSNSTVYNDTWINQTFPKNGSSANFSSVTTTSLDAPRGAGMVSSPNITSNTTGGINISSSIAYCYTGSGRNTILNKVTIPAQNNVAVTDDWKTSATFIYVDCLNLNYLVSYATEYDFITSNGRYIPYGEVIRDGNSLHISPVTIYADSGELEAQKACAINEYSITENSMKTLTVTLTSDYNISHTAIDTFHCQFFDTMPATTISERLFQIARNTSTDWQKTSATSPKVNYTHFDNGTGWQAFNASKIARCIYHGGVEVASAGHTYLRCVGQYNSISEAEADTTVPDMPVLMNEHTEFLATVIFNVSNPLQQKILYDRSKLSTASASNDYNSLVNKPDLTVYATIIMLNAVNTTSNIQSLLNQANLTPRNISVDYFRVLNPPTTCIGGTWVTSYSGNTQTCTGLVVGDITALGFNTTNQLNSLYYNISNPKNYQNDTQVNNSIINALATITYYPNATASLYVTATGGNNIGNLSFKDGQYANYTEASGVNAGIVYVNFSNVTSYNSIVLYYIYTGAHGLILEQLRCSDSAWVQISVATTSSVLTKWTTPVDDGSEHICSGVVQTRIRHNGNGNPTDLWKFDQWILQQGISVVSSTQDIYVVSFTNNNPGVDNQTLNITLNTGTSYTANVDVSFKLNVTDQRWNYSSIGNWTADKINYNTTVQLRNIFVNQSIIANCPSGQVIQNITTGGLQCVTAGGGSITPNSFQCGGTDQLYNISITSGGILSGICSAQGAGGAGYSTIQNNSVSLTQRSILNLIGGTGISLTAIDDATGGKTNITITSTSTVGGDGAGGWLNVTGVSYTTNAVSIKKGSVCDDALCVNGSIAIYDPVSGVEESLLNPTTGIFNFWGTLNTSNITLLTNCVDGEILKWIGGVGKCGVDNTGGGSVDNTIIRPNITIDNQPATYLKIEDDFFGPVLTTTTKPTIFTGISSGTAALIQPAGDASKYHPGEQSVLSSTTASSGAYIAPSVGTSANYIMNGSEQFEIIFAKGVKTGNTTTMFMGFHDSITAAYPVDGALFIVENLTLRGSVYSNSVSTNTSTNYTISESAGTQWYKARLSVAPDFSTVTYYLYNSTSGNTALLWNATLTPTAKPTITGRELMFGVSTIYVNGATTAQTLAYYDYMKVWVNKSIAR